MATITLVRDYAPSTGKVNIQERHLAQPSESRLRERRLRTAIKPARAPVRLYFSPESKSSLTPFRLSALEAILEAASKELERNLKSATVSLYYDHEEPVPPILLLTIVADVDRSEWTRARNAVTEAEIESAASWTDAEREDWQKMIYFDLIPLRI